MNIDSKLSDWQKHNLISEYQKNAILEYENRVKRPIFYYSLIFLSCFCISIGIIALIAANWEIIPQYIKLISAYVLVSGVGAGIYFSRTSDKIYLYEGLVLLFALLIFATIGLVGQIYHLPSQGLQAVLFWSALTFPLMFITQRPLFPALWMFGFSLSILDFCYKTPQLHAVLETLFEPHQNLGFCVTLTVLLFVWQSLKLLQQKTLLIALQGWIIALFACFALWLDMIGFGWEYNAQPLNFPQWQIYGVSLALFLALWKLSSAKRTSLAFICLSILYGYTFFANFLPKGEDILSALMMLSLLSIVGIFAYQNHHMRLFKTISILLALRFFGIYCEVFGSLLTTGLGLIISGVIFLSLAWYGRKLSTRFLQSMKGNTNA